MKTQHEQSAPLPSSPETPSHPSQAVVQVEKQRRFGRQAVKAAHKPTEEDVKRGYIKGQKGQPDRLIWDPNAPTYSPFDAD